MLKFTDKVIGTVEIPLEITEEMVEAIIVGSFEGGSNYWMGLDNSTEVWQDRPKGEPLSTWGAKLLLDGKSFVVYDNEEFHENDKSLEGIDTHELTLEKLLNGIKLNAIHRKWDADLENGDATTDDCIVQYALFGKIVYG